jgi:hypothetical protein
VAAEAVDAGATVLIALDNQFWYERYGMLIDPFGHHWSMSITIKMSPEEMVAKRKAVVSMFSKGSTQGNLVKSIKLCFCLPVFSLFLRISSLA